MPLQSHIRTPQHGARRRRQRRRNLLMLGGLILFAVILIIAVVLILRQPGGDGSAAPVPTAAPTEQAEATAIPESTPTAAPATTAEPTAEPSRTPQPTPEGMPYVVSFYTPQGKSYSPRVKMGDTFTAPWKKGEDIGSFEVITSDQDVLPGEFFGDIFGAAWKVFPAADLCKIGYTLRYTLDDSTEIRYTMLSPQHIEHTEYIEVWLYDDYHREPHQSYSHLKSAGGDTLMTSVKLTCGKQIEHVTDIWLTAFVCASLDEFDADRNYIGDTSCTIHILKQ